MSVQLAEYNKWRESFVGSKRNTIITDDGNCEGYLHLEEEDYFKKYFFVLNVQEMKLKRYNENPKRYPRMIPTVKDLVDIRYISKVAKCTKSKQAHAFEIHTPSSKYVLSAKVLTDMNYWVTALTKAATNPAQSSELSFDKNRRRCSSLESIDDQSFTTSIIGGVVIKTPVAPSGRSGSTTSDDVDQKTEKSKSSTGLKNLMEGWCWKQGLRMKNWKRRYFRLNTIKFSYYENDTISDPIRSIPSSSVQNVKILPRFCGRDDVIEVETPTRKFYMHVDGDDPMTWKEALEKIMLQNGMYLPQTKSV